MPAPIHFAPYDTCPGCGWTGHDWAYRYQRFCTKCYRRWEKEQRAQLRRLRPKNENVTVGSDLTVTRNVEKRLMGTAQAAVPFSRLQRVVDEIPVVIAFAWFGGPVAYFLLDLDFGVDGPALLIAWFLAGLIVNHVMDRISNRESASRFEVVRARLTELAEQRQRQIEEARAFYASPEWGLVRESVITAQGRTCRACGVIIKDDSEVTVDHILPRSKHPELALAKDNLQVLCRSCNSTKGDREPE